MSRFLLFLTAAGCLVSCISFPRYENQKRMEALYGEAPGKKRSQAFNNPFSRQKAAAKKKGAPDAEAGPDYDYNARVKTRQGFEDRYFR